MRKQDGCRVIIATDILMVGIDFPDIDDVIIIGNPAHTNDYIQKIGRAGRDPTLVSSPRGITYITSHGMAMAREQLGEAKQPKQKKGTTKKGTTKKRTTKKRTTRKRNTVDKSASSKSSMSQSMAKLIVSDCKTASLDGLYQNPPLDRPLRCNCSGCAPEPTNKPQRPKRGARGLTKEMKESARKRFDTLRRNIFVEEVQSELTNPFFVAPRVLPDELVSEIVDRLLGLDQNALSALVHDEKIVKHHIAKIWVLVVELRTTFQLQLKQVADEKAASRMYAPLSGMKLTHDTNYFSVGAARAFQRSAKKNQLMRVAVIQGTLRELVLTIDMAPHRV